jgi:RNA polymerase sigma factor (sigma-70 family)
MPAALARVQQARLFNGIGIRERLMRYSSKLELFERLRVRHTRFLENALWKLTGDRELFAEAMQNALLKMWQHIDKLDGPGNNGYLYRIAQSSVSMAWRNRAGTKEYIESDLAGVAGNPADEICDNESAQKVRYAITQLPAKQAKAVMMRYIEQKDYPIVAAELKCTEAAARSNVSKALVTLKRKLDNE